ncbi:MAG: Rdx family protein [Caldilineaceae bacterium]|nr:Rdx family protein [Caldilineaceae bacterium]
MAAELLDKFRFNISDLTMRPSSGGRFEVIVDDDLIYSKKALGRHAEAGEISDLFQKKTGLEPVEA